jgi:hypothetical protein
MIIETQDDVTAATGDAGEARMPKPPIAGKVSA